MRKLRRPAFTLVEMLVVIVIALVLFGLAVAIVPSIGDKRVAARAADQVQGWLLQARSRATRDQQPTGLRFIADADGLCRRMEFVQQPDAFQPRKADGTIAMLRLTPGVTGASTAELEAFASNIDAFRMGDLIQVKEGISFGWYRIISTNPNNPTAPMRITPDLASPTRVDTTDYTITRRWRALAGEPMLEMPKGTCVDLLKNAQPPTPTPDIDSHYGRAVPIISGEVVFLFAPDGGLIEAGGARPAVWVRHEENKGEPTLIAVTASNGAVAAHPVNDTKAPGMQNRLAAPFSFVEDGQGSGL